MTTPIKMMLLAIMAGLFMISVPAQAQDAATGDNPEMTEESSEQEMGQEEEEDDEVSWDDLVDEQERIVRSYVRASIMMSDAQADLADALELKDQAALARAEARALESAPTVDKTRLREHAKVSTATNTAIQRALKKNKELTDQQRTEFTRGMVSYVFAVEQTDNVVDEAKPFVISFKQKATSTAQKVKDVLTKRDVRALFGSRKASDGTDIKEMKGKLATGLYIGQKAPKLGVSHSKTLSQIASYMQDNDIAVPPEASLALNKFSKPEGGTGIFGKLKPGG